MFSYTKSFAFIDDHDGYDLFYFSYLKEVPSDTLPFDL